MPDGRYRNTGSFSRDELSRDAEFAEIRSELRTQGRDISVLVDKISVMAESVTSMSVQMGHLVTKESCSEGRAALAQDLKSRMDSRRDITGVDLPIKDLVKHYVTQAKPTPVPYKSRPTVSSDTIKAITEKKDRSMSFWVGIISGLLAIIGAIYASVVFVDRSLQRQERTEQILIEMQQKMAEGAGKSPQKQLPAKEN